MSKIAWVIDSRTGEPIFSPWICCPPGGGEPEKMVVISEEAITERDCSLEPSHDDCECATSAWQLGWLAHEGPAVMYCENGQGKSPLIPIEVPELDLTPGLVVVAICLFLLNLWKNHR